MSPFKKSFEALPPEVLFDGKGIRKRGILPEDPTSSHLHVLNHGTLKPGLRLPWFCHDDWDETIVMLSGEGTPHVEGKDDLHLEAGEIAYVPAKVSHALENTGSEDLVALFFKVATEVS